MIKTIVSNELPVDENFYIRKNVYQEGCNKKRICIVTGTHGDELEGQMVCYKVGQRLKNNRGWLNGEVDIYPALNPLGIDTIQRGIPAFDLDMNRIFPGNPKGSMAEQTATAIIEDLKGADLVIDIHSSNLYLRETPQVRINVLHEKELVPIAKLLNIDFIWVHDAATVLEATLAHSLNSTGTPCIVIEMGVGQRINNEMCNKLVDGIFYLMNNMNMWNENISGLSITEPLVCKGECVSFLNAEESGIFISEMKCGTYVSTGDLIGQIVNPLTSDVLSNVSSPIDGFLFTIRAYPIVYVGSLMARIYNIKKSIQR